MKNDLLNYNISSSSQQHLTEKQYDLIDKIRDDNSDEIAKIVIKNKDNKPTLTIEKKEFNLHDNHDSFFNTNTQQVISFVFLLERL